MEWRKIFGSPLEWAVEVSNKPVTQVEAAAACAAMGGRLPTRPELEAVLDLTCKDNAAWLGIPRGWYWTATDYAPFTGEAWVVHMSNGGVHSSHKTNGYYFWACRGGQSEDTMAERESSGHSSKWIEESGTISPEAWERLRCLVKMTLVKKLEKLCGQYEEDIPRLDIERLILEHCADQTCTAKERELIEAALVNRLSKTIEEAKHHAGNLTRCCNAVIAEREEKKE